MRPAVGVILARKEVDVTLLTQALQSGVREVVQAGDHSALAAACRRSHEISRRMLGPPARVSRGARTPGQIITVFAAKGGCGKTTLATNIGGRAGQAGGPPGVLRRPGPRLRRRGDQLPARSGAEHRGRAAVAGRPVRRPAPARCSRRTVPAWTCCWRRPARRGREDPAEPGRRLSPGCAAMFDFMVVDTPPQFSEHVLTALDASHGSSCSPRRTCPR